MGSEGATIWLAPIWPEEVDYCVSCGVANGHSSGCPVIQAALAATPKPVVEEESARE
jgi:hypothetical protein